MVKVIPVSNDPHLIKAANAAEKLFTVAKPKQLDDIWFNIFSSKKSLNEREIAYQKNKATVDKLKPLLKTLVIAQNAYARSKGYKNFLDFSLAITGRPEKNLSLIARRFLNITEKINRIIPKPKDGSEFYSPINIPDYICMVTKKRYSLPNDVIQLLGKEIPELEKYLPKIRFAENKKREWFDEAVFNKDTKTVTISMFPSNNLHGAITTAHEIGHALFDLKVAAEGGNLKSLTTYVHEKEAIKTELRFINLLPERLKKAALGELLRTFAEGSFECEIYTDPEQDFDKAYARAINRTYEEAKQEKNPFYVLEKTLVLRPCRATLRSIIYTEELSKLSN